MCDSCDILPKCNCDCVHNVKVNSTIFSESYICLDCTHYRFIYFEIN